MKGYGLLGVQTRDEKRSNGRCFLHVFLAYVQELLRQGRGFGMSPWICCSRLERCLSADRHSLPFPWTLSLHRRRCPSASHRPASLEGGGGAVKRPRQQPAQPSIRQLLGAADAQTAHPATSSTAPTHQLLGSGRGRSRKRHQQEHRPQRPTERSDPTQHAKGRTGACPGPRRSNNPTECHTGGPVKGRFFKVDFPSAKLWIKIFWGWVGLGAKPPPPLLWPKLGGTVHIGATWG